MLGCCGVVVVRRLKGETESEFRVRPAERRDAEDIFRLIHELAVYEREPDAVKITAETLAKDGWPENGEESPLFKAAMAEIVDATTGKWRSVGFALWFFVYSTVLSVPECDLATPLFHCSS